LNGRLFAVIGAAPVMEAHKMTRLTERPWQDEILFETVLPPLIAAPQRDVFEF
jgi:protein-L-isoaspartate(D-aspartate) O-methyltransferase